VFRVIRGVPGPEKLANRLLGIGTLDFAPTDLVEFVASLPPSVHPMAQKFTVLLARLLIGHS